MDQHSGARSERIQMIRNTTKACCWPGALIIFSVCIFPTATLFGQCPSDIDQSGRVDGGDIGALLGAWGACTQPCPSDLNGDGLVDGADLAWILADWGLGVGEDTDQDGIPDDCDPEIRETILLFTADFEHHTPGPYSEAMLEMDWNNPAWSNGVEEGRVSIVSTDQEHNVALAVFYPEGEYGTSQTGAQWKLDLDGSYEHVRVRYRLRFTDDFDFVRGGKLPGLIGGQGNTGGGIPNGSDGWSARMMWRTDGAITQYVYHPDQPQNYGEDLPWEIDGTQAHFVREQWHTVTHEIRMNTPGKNDGSIKSWLDGTLALDAQNMRFRDIPDFAIDRLYFSTFFGGGDASWSTSKDEIILFDDFRIEAIISTTSEQ